MVISRAPSMAISASESKTRDSPSRAKLPFSNTMNLTCRSPMPQNGSSGRPFLSWIVSDNNIPPEIFVEEENAKLFSKIGGAPWSTRADGLSLRTKGASPPLLWWLLFAGKGYAPFSGCA